MITRRQDVRDFLATICQYSFAKSAERKAVISFYVIIKEVT